MEIAKILGLWAGLALKDLGLSIFPFQKILEFLSYSCIFWCILTHFFEVI